LYIHVSIFTTAVDNSNITREQTYLIWCNYVHFGVVTQWLSDPFILQGKV